MTCLSVNKLLLMSMASFIELLLTPTPIRLSVVEACEVSYVVMSVGVK